MNIRGILLAAGLVGSAVHAAPPEPLVVFDLERGDRQRETGAYAYVTGVWDVSAYGEIAVTFAEPVQPGCGFIVRIENEGAEYHAYAKNHSRGVYEMTLDGWRFTRPIESDSWRIPPYVGPFQRSLSELYGVEVNGLQYQLWSDPMWVCYFKEDDIQVPNGRMTSWTLDPHRVVKVGVAFTSGETAPKLKRIVFRGRPNAPTCDSLPRFATLEPEDFFPLVDRYGQFRHREWPGKIHSDEDLVRARETEAKELAAKPGPADWDKWGGWAKGPQLRATGHFRVEKVNGMWWFVDPDGHLWWSHGPVRVSRSCGMTPLYGKRMNHFEWLPPREGDEFSRFYRTRDALLWPYYVKYGVTNTYDFTSSNLHRKYGPDYIAKWCDVAHRRLRSWGANTIANSSDRSVMELSRTPYCDRFELKSRPIEGTTKVRAWWPFRDPFDPSFRENIRENLKAHEREFRDPWCFGFFVDNELPWGGKGFLGRAAWDSPEDQPARIEFVKWLGKKHGRVPEKPSDEDCDQFSYVIARGYFRGVREELKKFAPDKLYLGCRFSGGCPYVRTAVEYCDVISSNFYRPDFRRFALPEFDKPFIIGEFHMGALDRGMFNTGLIWLDSQEARAKGYERYLRYALTDRRCIGAHWHQFSDDVVTGRFDGENFQIGWVDVCDTPYPETIGAVRRIGYDMYRIRSAAAPVRLGEPFGDHMVLQRGMKVPVWGTAGAGETVKVEFGGRSATAVADADGRWTAYLPPMPACGEPRDLTVSVVDASQTISQSCNRTVLSDVLVGEVWFAVGRPGIPGMRGADDPDTRVLEVARWPEDRPQTSFFTPARWKRGGPGCPEPSGVPTGVIVVNWEGSTIQSWIPPREFERDPALSTGYSRYAHHRDSGLWNGMVNPLVPFAATGVLWYQGRSNSGRHDLERKALLDGWRREFGNPGLRIRIIPRND